MYEDVELKLKKKNKILFSRDSKCLKELINLIRVQNHKVLVLWAFECVKTPIKIFESKYPNEKRLTEAFELCQKWASGQIKMPIAKKAILACHSIAHNLDDIYYISLCHAVGQGLSTVHVETHAIGLPLYELTSIVLENKEDYEKKVESKIKYYIDTLLYFQNNINNIDFKWTDFLLKDKENKENLLWKKRENL